MILVFVATKSRCDPEELLVASLSACHMLWYLHLCSVNQGTILDYRGAASGLWRSGEKATRLRKSRPSGAETDCGQITEMSCVDISPEIIETRYLLGSRLHGSSQSPHSGSSVRHA